MKQAFASHRNIRIIIIAIIYLLLAIKRDSSLPLTHFANPETATLINALLALFILTLLIIYALPLNKLPEFLKKYSLKVKKLPVLTILTVCNLLQIGFTDFLFIYENNTHKDIYQLNYPVFFLMIFLALLLLLLPLSKLMIFKKLGIASIFSASLALMLIPILFFPISAKVTDLLPIIGKQLDSFTSGTNIYQYYLLDNGIIAQTVRQPGMFLSYLPVYLLNMDLRWANVFYTLLTGFFIWKSYRYLTNSRNSSAKNFQEIYLLLSLFLLSPYRIIRSDLYDPVFWLLLSISIYFLIRKKLLGFTISYAMAIFVQVWAWLFAPFFAVFLLKTYPLKKALLTVCGYLAMGFGMLAIFILREPRSYLEHIFGFYQKANIDTGYTITTMYFSRFLEILQLSKLAFPLQLISTAAGFIVAITKKLNLPKMLLLLAFLFFFFIQFISISWNYMYFTATLLLTWHFILTYHQNKHLV